MISAGEVITRLLVAAALGSLIGWERERRTWTAGLRTHMMVCLGSTLIMLVSAYGFSGVVGTKGIVLDPSRVAAQVVSGIGFLGAGTILFLRNEVVKGLTTAAGLWTVAAIGLAIGGGLYYEGILTTVIAFVILIAIKPLENKYFSKNKYKLIKITVKANQTRLERIEEILTTQQVHYSEINLSSAEEGKDEIRIRFQKNLLHSNQTLTLIDQIKKVDGVTEVNFVT